MNKFAENSFSTLSTWTNSRWVQLKTGKRIWISVFILLFYVIAQAQSLIYFLSGDYASPNSWTQTNAAAWANGGSTPVALPASGSPGYQ